MEFLLIGPLIVRRGGSPLFISYGKQRAVLAALLARAGCVVLADELIELIWAGCPPPSARITLQNHVRRLRRALGQPSRARLMTSGSGYVIDAGPEELDLTRFSMLCRTGRDAVERGEWSLAANLLSAALSLWRGQPFLDVSCPLLTLSEVPRLAELRLTALEDRIEADLHLGRHRLVIPELRQLVEAERFRERLYSLLMLALFRAGRQADALQTYQAARRSLTAELGVEPGADLRLLHQQILTADPALALRCGPPGCRAAWQRGPACGENPVLTGEP